jgi:DHA2 family multidrug resistance protein
MSAVDQAREAPWQPRHNPWAIAIVVTLAAFMEILDTTIVNVALPHIAGSLSTSNDEASWALTSYLVANGIVLTISGWLSAVIGRKRYFLICLSMFTVCSLLCGCPTSAPMRQIGRVEEGRISGSS